MTSIGHTLMGFSFGNVFVSKSGTQMRKTALYCIYGAIANLPDYPLPMWGHNKYHISHSIFVLSAIGILITIISAAIYRVAGTFDRNWCTTSIGLYLTLISHLILDSFYYPGDGIAIFWPFSQLTIHFPVVFFHQISLQHLFAYKNLTEFVAESIFYGGIFSITMIIRLKRGKK